VKVGGNKSEELLSLKGSPVFQLAWVLGGIAPDGTPLFVAIPATQEIYALELRAALTHFAIETLSMPSQEIRRLPAPTNITNQRTQALWQPQGEWAPKYPPTIAPQNHDRGY